MLAVEDDANSVLKLRETAFSDVPGSTTSECFVNISWVGMAGDKDDPNRRPALGNAHCGLKAIHHRHGDIQQQDVRLVLFRGKDGSAPISNEGSDTILRLQCLSQSFAHSKVVIDN